MANFLAYTLLGALFVVLQGTLLAFNSVGGIRIDLLLVMVTYVALYHSLLSGSLLVMLLGYFYDLNSASPYALHILTFLSCFIFLYLTKNRLYIQGPAFCIGLVAFVVFFHDIAQMIFLSSRGVSVVPRFVEVIMFIPKALLTGVCWPILSPIFHAVDEWFPPSSGGMSKRSVLEFKM